MSGRPSVHHAATSARGNTLPPWPPTVSHHQLGFRVTDTDAAAASLAAAGISGEVPQAALAQDHVRTSRTGKTTETGSFERRAANVLRMGGHLFIINGDLTRLACDAVLPLQARESHRTARQNAASYVDIDLAFSPRSTVVQLTAATAAGSSRPQNRPNIQPTSTTALFGPLNLGSRVVPVQERPPTGTTTTDLARPPARINTAATRQPQPSSDLAHQTARKIDDPARQPTGQRIGNSEIRRMCHKSSQILH